MVTYLLNTLFRTQSVVLCISCDSGYNWWSVISATREPQTDQREACRGPAHCLLKAWYSQHNKVTGRILCVLLEHKLAVVRLCLPSFHSSGRTKEHTKYVCALFSVSSYRGWTLVTYLGEKSDVIFLQWLIWLRIQTAQSPWLFIRIAGMSRTHTNTHLPIHAGTHVNLAWTYKGHGQQACWGVHGVRGDNTDSVRGKELTTV